MFWFNAVIDFMVPSVMNVILTKCNQIKDNTAVANYLAWQPRPDSGGGWGDGHWPNVSGQQQRPPQKASSMSGAWDINDWMSGSRRVGI